MSDATLEKPGRPGRRGFWFNWGATLLVSLAATSWWVWLVARNRHDVTLLSLCAVATLLVARTGWRACRDLLAAWRNQPGLEAWDRMQEELGRASRTLADRVVRVSRDASEASNLMLAQLRAAHNEAQKDVLELKTVASKLHQQQQLDAARDEAPEGPREEP